MCLTFGVPVTQQENPERIRDFLKKIGSNFRIADRTLVLDFKNAWILAGKYHTEALCADLPAGRQGVIPYDFSESTNWRRREDLNLRGLSPCLISSEVLSTTQPRLQISL